MQIDIFPLGAYFGDVIGLNSNIYGRYINYFEQLLKLYTNVKRNPKSLSKKMITAAFVVTFSLYSRMYLTEVLQNNGNANVGSKYIFWCLS